MYNEITELLEVTGCHNNLPNSLRTGRHKGCGMKSETMADISILNSKNGGHFQSITAYDPFQ